MKRNKRDVAGEIIADLKQMHATLKAGIPLREKYTVRTVRTVPAPANYDASAVRATRNLVGVSQSVFAGMLGVSPALVRSWECGQRKPSALARRLLDEVRSNPKGWRAMLDAA